MSCHRSSRMSSSDEDGSRYNERSPGGASWSAHGPSWGCHGGAHWRPLEIAAIVLGFLLFWPLGLAILFLKLWQRSFGYQGDMFSFARERFQQTVGGEAAVSPARPARSWGGPSFMRATGNVAFDEWREGELARLEEERRKLAEAERDFAEHIDQLRRARDRDEFDTFMRDRKGAGKPNA